MLALFLKPFLIERRKPLKVHVRLKYGRDADSEQENESPNGHLSATDKKRLRRQKVANSVDFNPSGITRKVLFINNDGLKAKKGIGCFTFCGICGESTNDVIASRDLGSPAAKERGVSSNDIIDETVKMKRFVSQARNKKKENKLQSGAREETKSEDEERFNDIDENVISFLDVEPLRQKVVHGIIQQRQRKREVAKQELQQRGIVDVVAVNSGPPANLIKSGYVLSSEPPLLTLEYLQYKRVMYKWEGVHPKAEGWFFGMIATASRVSGCNFAIKYDRMDTGSVYVDGVKNVLLELKGDNAYGRKWVIVFPQSSDKSNSTSNLKNAGGSS